MEQADFIRMVNDNPTQKVWSYLRVSSTKQVSDGDGLDTQKHAVLQYCRNKGLSEPLCVEEVASATKPLFKLRATNKGIKEETESEPRPMLIMLIGYLCDIDDAHLVVWDLDRLARQAVDQELIFQLLWSNNVTIHCANAMQADALLGDNTDPQRVLYRTILGAFKQYEAAMVRARLDSGLVRKAALGGFVGGGTPIGYRVENGELVIDENKAVLIRYIFLLRKVYKLSYRAIQTWLLDHKNEVPAADCCYSHMMVKRVIDNEKLYRGVYTDRFNQEHSRPDLCMLPASYEELQSMLTGGA